MPLRPDPHVLDIDLLRAFAAIADTGSLTRAAARTGRTQSAVSLQLQRLEAAAGATLADRKARPVTLTDDGRTLLAHARRIIDAHDSALADLRGTKLAGVVRLGTPEDFATAHLPDVLGRFSAAFPDVALEVTCDLTLNLIEAWRNGAFDMVLVKREPHGAAADGVAVWRERLVWAAGPKLITGKPVLPLVVSPQPCVYRKRATSALTQAGLDWRIVYTSPSLAGTQAAVRAGLGVTVLPEGMVPADFKVLGEDAGLPDLKETEIALMARDPLSRPAQALRRQLVAALEAGSAGLTPDWKPE
ncbi:MAG: LysR substrate-binding domain-containing protein [Rhizobiaceae bacterium]|jgi:DNA-binding transcriptional LysR family regulator|nr:LysR substrate-binding domain-containing protein [Rhizobiaceae bacterium]